MTVVAGAFTTDEAVQLADRLAESIVEAAEGTTKRFYPEEQWLQIRNDLVGRLALEIERVPRPDDAP